MTRLRTLRLYLGLAVVASLALGLLLVTPVLVALGASTQSPLEHWVTLAIYGMAWLLNLVFLLDAVSFIYDFNRPFISHLPRRYVSWTCSTVRTPRGGFVTALLSFAASLYGYLLLYIYVSHRYPKSFNVGPLDFSTATYFTVVTAATVGFGDVVPTSSLTKLLVASQIVLSFLYGIFVLSTVAALAMRKGDE